MAGEAACSTCLCLSSQMLTGPRADFLLMLQDEWPQRCRGTARCGRCADLSGPAPLSKAGLKQNPSVWAWLRRVAVLLNHLAPGAAVCTAHWQRQALEQISQGEDLHSRNATTAPRLGFALGCFPLAADSTPQAVSWMLCSGHRGTAKSCEGFSPLAGLD